MVNETPSTPLTLVVLAAGMGSRYGGLKQLDAIGPGGEVILDFSVQDAIAAGFSKVVFVIRRDFADAFKRSVVCRYYGAVQTAICFQDLDDLPGGFTAPEDREKPWGTAHAVYAARHAIDGPFAVINADDFYGCGAFEVMASVLSGYTAEVPQLSMVAYQLENTLSDHGGVNRGVCTVDAGGLTGIAEHIDIRVEADGVLRGTAPVGRRVVLAEDTPVSMNFWGFNALFLEEIERVLSVFLETERSVPRSECYLPFVVDAYLSRGEGSCAVLTTDEKWFGVTYPEDKPRVVAAVQKLFDAGVYSER